MGDRVNFIHSFIHSFRMTNLLILFTVNALQNGFSRSVVHIVLYSLIHWHPVYTSLFTWRGQMAARHLHIQLCRRGCIHWPTRLHYNATHPAQCTHIVNLMPVKGVVELPVVSANGALWLLLCTLSWWQKGHHCTRFYEFHFLLQLLGWLVFLCWHTCGFATLQTVHKPCILNWSGY